MISQVLTELVPGNKTVLKITMGALASSATQLAVDDINLTFEYTQDTSKIKVGDDLYEIDILTDAAIQAVAGLTIITAFGFSSSLIVSSIYANRWISRLHLQQIHRSHNRKHTTLLKW
jgi:hypothetical protein